MSKNIRIFFIVLTLALLGYYALTQKTKEVSGSADFLKQVPTSGWKPYAADNGSFTMLFPRVPDQGSATQPIEVTGEIVRYDIYSSIGSDGTKYMLNIATYPESVDLSHPKELLEGLLIQVAKGSMGHDIVSQEQVLFEGYPALDFVLVNPKHHTRGRSVLAGRSLYLITVVNGNEQLVNTNFPLFADSLTIKKGN